MPISRLLIANRGEIAIRIARTAADLGIATVAVHSADDAQSLHVRAADTARALEGSGPAAYLDAAQIVAVARAEGCDAIHPGYGFISENAAFARLCGQAGIAFVGPTPEVLDLFGDKAQARRFGSTRFRLRLDFACARQVGRPANRGTHTACLATQNAATPRPRPPRCGRSRRTRRDSGAWHSCPGFPKKVVPGSGVPHFRGERAAHRLMRRRGVAVLAGQSLVGTRNPAERLLSHRGQRAANPAPSVPRSPRRW